jgi:bifunctional non-homologous end joining protein LigD
VAATFDDGAALLAACTAQGLEGVMAKRIDSRYEAGRRSRTWVKAKVRRRQELVIGGWLPGERGRQGRIGAVLVGYHDRPGAGPLRFAGRVGTGFTDAELDRLAARFAPLHTDICPFAPPPSRAEAPGATWLEPELVCEVAFGEWTGEGRLRHPSYLGLRVDKDPDDVVREP